MKTLNLPDAAALHAAVARARFVRRCKQHRRDHDDARQVRDPNNWNVASIAVMVSEESGDEDLVSQTDLRRNEEPRVAEPDHDVRVRDHQRLELVPELALGLYLATKQHFTLQPAKRRKMPRVLGKSAIDFLDDLVQRLDFDELRGAGHGASL